DVPRGGVAASPDAAARIAKELGGPVVVKIQAWTTGRKAMGGVVFAKSDAEARDAATRLLAMKVGNFPVTHVLVEEQLKIAHELFVSLTIDDSTRRPVLLIAGGGGTGIEERAASVSRIPCDVAGGPEAAALAAAIAKSGVPEASRATLADAARKMFDAGRAVEARSVEINPLVVLADGRVMAADCRMTIDDYAVFRHPELGIEIARELDHPPTALERLAYRIEQEDHRGTFFFAQMNTGAPAGGKGLIGFHGAGGGGSMMSMDAIAAEGFTLANFCDTSGNPSVAKVYRAARIILSQPELVGYFGSGSGVANQEQFWSAYGLAKAFNEMKLDIPCVIRLGGNGEDRAVDILTSACRGLGVKVEGFKKTDPPARIAARFAGLVEERRAADGTLPAWTPRTPSKPAFVGSGVSMEVRGGRVWIDPAAWRSHGAAIAARSGGLLRDEGGTPVATLPPETFATKDNELIACEVECLRDGIGGFFVELDMPDLAPGR
ncbi:MAG: acetate--CoA ligase family protein, partial [Phycisphaerae bacterium]|nr:acetate--CoA ligase family protein [Phycisphaerae bacterium]